MRINPRCTRALTLFVVSWRADGARDIDVLRLGRGPLKALDRETIGKISGRLIMTNGRSAVAAAAGAG
jgi:hypothetical protein